MKTFAIACVLGVLATAASAQTSGSSYDWQTGNSYNWTKNYDGSTTVRGYNSQTGSMWNQTIQNNGDQRGQDSQGNFWQYDAQTKNYNNFGTGQFCTVGFNC